MKKYFYPILAFTLSAFALNAQAQHTRTCGVLSHEAYLQQQQPARAAERTAYEQNMAARLANANTNAVQSAVTIPVVVHVVYNTTAQNISTNQILSQIAVLNQDFTGTNSDISNTPAAFQGSVSNPNIQFCLAKQDPSGNFTDGIERRQNTVVTSFIDDDKVKHYSQGGLDAWDPAHYFNIWVCNLGGGLLGYAEFPSSAVSQTYGVVIGYYYFGSNYTPYGTFSLDPEYNRGRTTTHEVGHCFNLYHIWGDDTNADGTCNDGGGQCSGSDVVADTPNQCDCHYGAFAVGSVQTDACTTTSPGTMWMNYMDYTDDVSMYMFTAGQVSRMTNVINTAPYNSLATSNKCQLAGVEELSSGITLDVFPNPSTGKFSLEIALASQAQLQITVTNTLGETVYSLAQENSNGGMFAIDLSQEANGVYFVEVRAGNALKTERVVLNR